MIETSSQMIKKEKEITYILSINQDELNITAKHKKQSWNINANKQNYAQKINYENSWEKLRVLIEKMFNVQEFQKLISP